MIERFCAKPFEHLEIQHDGNAYLCCAGWLRRSIGNAFETNDLEALWNGQIAQEIRASIFDQSFRYCDRCPFLAEAKGPVQRIEEVTDPRHLELLRAKPVTMPRVHLLNAAYDRSCNLACPSCREDFVVASTEEYEARRRFQDGILARLTPVLDWLYVTGSGDPFASRLFRELLRSLDAARFPRLKVYLHTNALLFNRENWDSIERLWPAIHTVHISIDASTAATYAVNRRGGDWATLLSNLEMIAGLRAKGPIKQLEISFVVQRNNWREMPGFVELGQRLNVDTILFTPLQNWETFSEAELAARAVHLPRHAEHATFRQSLANPVFQAPRVILGDFAVASDDSDGKRRLPLVAQ